MSDVKRAKRRASESQFGLVSLVDGRQRELPNELLPIVDFSCAQFAVLSFYFITAFGNLVLKSNPPF